MADALNMIPAAIAAGFGELGSLINRNYGSGFRLSAVATDLPLEFDSPHIFGADEVCLNYQVCRNENPPMLFIMKSNPCAAPKNGMLILISAPPILGKIMRAASALPFAHGPVQA